MSYNDKQLEFIKKLRDDTELSWDEIRDEFNEQFNDNKTKNAIRKTYKRLMEQLGNPSELDADALIKNIQSSYRAKKENLKLKKENKVLSEFQFDYEELMSGVRSAIREVSVSKISVRKKKKGSKTKTKMTIEGLLSDIHYGLKTSKDNLETNRSKMRTFSNTFIDEIERYSKNYNVEKAQLLLNGDIIQSATMHRGSESSCDMTNAEQLAAAINSLYFDLIVPIAKEGLPLHIIGMSGNHDREQHERFTVDPGKHYYTFTIYSALRDLAKASGLKNVTFEIPERAYHTYEMYGKYFLVEHGDCVGSKATPDILERHMMKRSTQVGKILHGIRIGHFHNDFVGGCGRYIINGGFPSEDHYGDILGYKSRPCQLINYYVETDRETSYYHSFAVNLEK